MDYGSIQLQVLQLGEDRHSLGGQLIRLFDLQRGKFLVKLLGQPGHVSGAKTEITLGDFSDGPAPIVLFDESFTYPPPPEDPSIAATLTIGLDRDGFGYFNATDIILGAVDTPFGFLQIEALRVAGSVTVTPIGTFNPSDVNGDGAVNVIDLLAVLTAFGSNDPDADVNDDGVVNVIDLLQVLQDWTG